VHARRETVLHGDNEATLKATTVLAMLNWLGIKLRIPSRVSDDNLMPSFVPHRQIPAGVTDQRLHRSRYGAGMGHALRPLVQ